MFVTKSNQAKVLQQAVKILKSGGLVVYPTETVYGAGVDATNQAAVDKLLAYKSRREGKPLSIAVSNQAMAEQYVEVNDQARALYRQFLPGPMTIISSVTSSTVPAKESLPQSPQLAQGVTSEFNTLGIRIPDYPLVIELVKQLGRPITATSANASGKRRPYSVNQILDNLSTKQKNLIDLIIDAGELPHRPPSTVIDTTLSTPVVFRQGTLLNKQSPTTSLISHSESETQAIAGKLLLKHWDTVNLHPLIIGLNGPLGAGKTVFAKGIAQFLGITTPLVSPTYTYIEEYDFSRHQTQGQLFHIDAWKIDSADLFDRLNLTSQLHPRHILVIEWYSQIKDWLASALQSTQTTAVEVTLIDQGETRVLDIFDQ